VLPLQAEAARRLELTAAAAAAGVAAQTVQVVCLREILQIARGGEAVLGISLASWLVGTSAGAATWRWRPAPAAWLVALVPLALLPLLRSLSVPPGSWAPAAALLAGVGAYAPGAFFAAILRRGAARPAIAWEAVGACAAGALLTFLLLQALGAFALLGVAGALCLLTAGRTPRWAGLLLLPGALLLGPPVDRLTLRPHVESLWRGSVLERARESRYGRLLWLRRDVQRSLFVNGHLALTVPDDVDAEAFVNVVLALHPSPRRVLVVGLGVAGILRECRRHPVQRLELAVHDPDALALLERDLPAADRSALAQARVLIGDPRRIAASEPRDVVLVLAPEPLTLATNRFYTEEFFASLKLEPGGFVAIRLPAAPNEREGEILARNVSVFRAMQPLAVRVLPGTSDLLLGGRPDAPDAAPATIARRLAERGVSLRHHVQDFYAETLRPEEVARVTAAYRDYPKPPPPLVPFAVPEPTLGTPLPEPLPNRDLLPGAVLHSAAALARKEQVPLLRIGAALGSWTPFLLLPWAALGVVWTWRRGQRAAARLTTATAGATSMGLWVVLLMAHQARVGALYGDLALLAAAFMAGFALGSHVRVGPRRLDLAFLAVCLLTAVALPHVGRFGSVVLAALAGAAGGATLGNAAAAHGSSAPRLYAWDLLGAAAAALLFGGFLVPALGATAACATAAGLKVCSLAGSLLARPWT
jgi:spermidine synthase